ncbi:MAG TPA: hypothetical protein VLL96_01850, partial [Candidatus Deferrimicrobiaceae bacterium]|nr:hypothetical protein [Candidatus Deferrimicrobiaceae bacterium]
MKTLWLEIPQTVTQLEKEALLNLGFENADVVLQDEQVSDRNGRLDLVFLADLNEKRIAQLKR